jgi:ABC-type sugar transport system ATPase subunit
VAVTRDIVVSKDGPSGAGGPSSAGGTPPVVEVRGITKRFGSVLALRGADLALYPGEILGLVGDNGAGKSTLVNIISGALAPNGGEIFVGGEKVHIGSPLDARRYGIETVYQDLALAPDLSVWANVFLGRERIVRGPMRLFGWLDRRAMASEAREQLDRTRIRIDSVDALVGKLSGGQRQAVAVGRSAAWGSRVLLLDEPTAALGVEQQERVGELVRSIAAQGLPVLLISHNLPQVHELCSRVAVMFQGRVIATLKPSESGIDEIVSWITGAALVARKPE